MTTNYEDILYDDYLAEKAHEEAVNVEVNKRLAAMKHKNKDIDYLVRLLQDGETSKIEVKLSMDGPKDNIAKAVCGIANQRGGRVVVGLAEKKFYRPEMGDYTDSDIVAEDFIVFGVGNPDNARIQLSSHLKSNTNLGTNLDELYSVSEVTLNGKKIVIIKVKPYFQKEKKVVLYKNEIYKRIDNQTIKLTMSDIVGLFNGGGSFDNNQAINATKILDAVENNRDAVNDAIRVVIEYNKASTSLLQRRLRIGYGKAARLIDRLEAAGIIGAKFDSRPRDVLIKDIEQAQKLIRNRDQ